MSCTVLIRLHNLSRLEPKHVGWLASVGLLPVLGLVLNCVRKFSVGLWSFSARRLVRTCFIPTVLGRWRLAIVSCQQRRAGLAMPFPSGAADNDYLHETSTRLPGAPHRFGNAIPNRRHHRQLLNAEIETSCQQRRTGLARQYATRPMQKSMSKMCPIDRVRWSGHPQKSTSAANGPGC